MHKWQDGGGPSYALAKLADSSHKAFGSLPVHTFGKSIAIELGDSHAMGSICKIRSSEGDGNLPAASLAWLSEYICSWAHFV